MTKEQNLKAILECYFAGFQEEIIDRACKRILYQFEYLDDTEDENDKEEK